MTARQSTLGPDGVPCPPPQNSRVTSTLWADCAALMPAAHRGAWTHHLADLRGSGTPPAHIRVFQTGTLPAEAAALLTFRDGRLAVWPSPGLRNVVLTLRGPAGDTLLTVRAAPEHTVTGDQPDTGGFTAGTVNQPHQWGLSGAQLLAEYHASSEDLQLWARQGPREARMRRAGKAAATALLVALVLVMAWCGLLAITPA